MGESIFGWFLAEIAKVPGVGGEAIVKEVQISREKGLCDMLGCENEGEKNERLTDESYGGRLCRQCKMKQYPAS